jgi:hypothetical protein
MVGYLVWKSERRRQGPVFQPGRTVVSAPVLSKLNYFVALTAPDSYERLQTLRSEFWSFVQVATDDTSRPRPD